MATDNKDVCNLALDNLGVTNKIVSLADATKEARACARWYEHVGQYLLRRFPWPFAARSAVLTLAATEITHTEWPYVFGVPTGFLKLRRLFIEGQPRNTRPLSGRVIGVDPTGSLWIGCDQNDGVCAEYTLNMVLASAAGDAFVPWFPAEFVDAFAWKLATRLVIPLALDKGLITDAENMYRMVVADAFSVSSEEVQMDEPLDPDYLRARE